MNRKRLEPNARRAEILAAALIVAANGHYARMTRAQIAGMAGVAGPTVQHYLGTMSELREAVMREAVSRQCLVVIAQGLLAKDQHALCAPETLRRQALNTALGS